MPLGSQWQLSKWVETGILINISSENGITAQNDDEKILSKAKWI